MSLHPGRFPEHGPMRTTCPSRGSPPCPHWPMSRLGGDGWVGRDGAVRLVRARLAGEGRLIVLPGRVLGQLGAPHRRNLHATETPARPVPPRETETTTRDRNHNATKPPRDQNHHATKPPRDQTPTRERRDTDGRGRCQRGRGATGRGSSRAAQPRSRHPPQRASCPAPTAPARSLAHPPTPAEPAPS